METRYLRSFIKIAETGSITRAAESLGISQPSLSQQILRLEDEVGVPLFSRTARGVTLTESGKRLLVHARHILDGVHSAFEEARQSGEALVGEVILAVPPTISRIAGAALFTSMAKRAPLVRFRLVEAMTAQIWGWVEDAKVDLGILNYMGPKRDLSFRQIASEELVAVGPAGAFGSLDEAPAMTLADIASMPLILPGLPHGLRQIIDHEASRRGIELAVFRELDALALVPALISDGHGLSILPLSAVTDALREGMVSIARLEQGSMERHVALARNSTTVITHASLVCEEVVAEVLQDLIRQGAWRARLPADGAQRKG